MTPTIVVFGCTGTVGQEVMRRLSDRDCLVRGILRTPERAFPVELNPQRGAVSYISAALTSDEQLYRACLGADALFLLTATAPGQAALEINIIRAAVRAGVGRIVKLSAPVVLPPVQVEVSGWHREVEACLARTTLDYCCLRPCSFMQNWERNTFTIRRFGKLFGAMNEAPRNYIDCRNVAEIAVHYLLANEPLNGQMISLAGPEAITNPDMAERLTWVTRAPVAYMNLTPDEFFGKLTKQAGLPHWLAHHIVQLDELAVAIPEPTVETVSALLGHSPRTMDAYLQESRRLFSRKPLWQFWSS